MHINDICFSKIDNPIEAFITPPNDPLAGILMDQMPKDKIEITGSIGDKEFQYDYSVKGQEIVMKGSFGGEGFEASGIFSQSVALSGSIGANRLFSTISPSENGPLNTGMAGEIEVNEKITYSLSNSSFTVDGKIGRNSLKETFCISGDQMSVIDNGAIGGHEIIRTAKPVQNGFKLEGTIGGIPFREYIIAKKEG